MPTRTLATLAATGLTALFAAAPAAAVDITTSNVTSPADGARLLATDAGEQFTISGTSDGGTGDEVRFYCPEHATEEPGDGRFFGSDTLDANGDFSLTLPVQDGYGTCRLLALPESYNSGPLPPGSFSGPVFTIDERRTQRVGAGPNAGRLFNMILVNQQSEAFWDYYSINDCSLCDMRLTRFGPFDQSEYLFYGNMAIYGGDSGNGEPYLRVNGRNAYGPDEANDINPDAPGFPPLTYNSTFDPVTRDGHITESMNWVRCATDVLNPTATDCPEYFPTGLRLDRVARSFAGGRSFEIADEWFNATGDPMRLQIHYEQYFNVPFKAPGVNSFQFPWAGGYAERGSGESVGPPPSSPATLFVKSKSDAPDGSFHFPQGSVTFTPAPSSFYFATAQWFFMDYDVTVPPGGSARFMQAFHMATTRGELDASAAASEDKFAGPQVRIDSPADGSSTGRRAIDVAGTASDNKGIASLKVNGRDTPVGAGGAWSQRVDLQPGRNTVTAVATDGAGNSAQAQRSVTLDPAATLIGSLSMLRRRFGVDDDPTAVNAQRRRRARRIRRGSAFRYSLSEPSRVQIRIERARAGLKLRSGRRTRCVTRNRRNLRRLQGQLSRRRSVRRLSGNARRRALARLVRRARCTLYTRRGTLTRARQNGRVNVPFSGRIGRRALRPGSYRAVITATDDVGNVSRPRRITFTILRG